MHWPAFCILLMILLTAADNMARRCVFSWYDSVIVLWMSESGKWFFFINIIDFADSLSWRKVINDSFENDMQNHRLCRNQNKFTVFIIMPVLPVILFFFFYQSTNIFVIIILLFCQMAICKNYEIINCPAPHYCINANLTYLLILLLNPDFEINPHGINQKLWFNSKE